MAPPANDTTTRPTAADLLAEAWSTVYRWPAGHPGFSARFTVRHSGPTLTGTVRVGGTSRCDLSFDQPDGAVGELERWCREQLASLVAHRRHTTFTDGDGQNAVSYGDDSPHLLGPQLAVADQFDSTYRVRDGQITEIIRHLPDMTVCVHVLERAPAPDGRLLPRRVLSTYGQPSGRITRIEAIDETWAEVGDVMLPRRRTVLRLDCLDTDARTLEFTELRVAEPG